MRKYYRANTDYKTWEHVLESLDYFQDLLGKVSEYAQDFPSIKNYARDFGKKFAKDIGVGRVVGAVQETLPDRNDDEWGREVERETISFAYDLPGLDSSVLDGVMSYTYKQYSEQQQIDPNLEESLVQGLREKQEGAYVDNAPKKSNPVLDGVLKELDGILAGLGNAGEFLSKASSRVGLSENDVEPNVTASVNESLDVNAKEESTKWRDRVGGSNAATTRSQSQGGNPGFQSISCLFQNLCKLLFTITATDFSHGRIKLVWCDLNIQAGRLSKDQLPINNFFEKLLFKLQLFLIGQGGNIRVALLQFPIELLQG